MDTPVQYATWPVPAVLSRLCVLVSSTSLTTVCAIDSVTLFVTTQDEGVATHPLPHPRPSAASVVATDS
jgi:hypothetical protein